MSNTKLISLFGIDPQYDENSPTDFSQINTKSFSKKYHQLKAAQNFKPVWENSKEILEHIATLKSKKQLNQAK